jgi:hypothetical protein
VFLEALMAKECCKEGRSSLALSRIKIFCKHFRHFDNHSWISESNSKAAQKQKQLVSDLGLACSVSSKHKHASLCCASITDASILIENKFSFVQSTFENEKLAPCMKTNSIDTSKQ